MPISRRPPAILVLYYARGVAQLPMRKAIEDHLFCWRDYSRFPTIFHNFAFGFDWNAYADLSICAIVLDTLALNLRWDPDFFLRKIEPLRAIAAFTGPKLAMPQDEFVFTDVLCDVLADLGVTHLLSAAAPHVARWIYRKRLPNVRLGQKLTGYLDEKTVAHIAALAGERDERDIDIGYRAWHAEPWLGEHGQLKVLVAERVAAAARRRPDLRVDISTADQAVLLGDDWLRFLLRCRTTLGAEGGASVLDRDGSIRARTRAFIAAAETPPSFEEVRRACFAADEGSLELFAIGPRHLEACATRTCQILVEGSYQGILRPNLDYIPVRRDFSNLDEVLSAVGDHARLRATAESAYQSIVASQRYTYRRFVQFAESFMLPPKVRRSLSVPLIGRAAAIARAISRNERIRAFANHEAGVLFSDRLAYDYSEDPKWVKERRMAQKLAARTGITLDPD